MAAATVASPTLDLNSQAIFQVRLGASLLQPSQSRSRKSKTFSSLRYNHKPLLGGDEDVKSVIKHVGSDPARDLQLDIRKGSREYRYDGNDTGHDDRYVLVPRTSGDDMEFVLEKLDSCLEFNLREKAHDTSSAGKQYPQLPEESEHESIGEQGENDLLEIEDIERDAMANVHNPFDYRNYMKAHSTSREPLNATPSGANTPPAPPRPASTTPHSRPSKRSEGPLVAQKKRKAQETAKSNTKRVKAGTEPPQPDPATRPTRQSVPKLRMDRKASLQVPPLDDSGELVVDDETPKQEKPRGAMALALAGQLGQGPISLRSAASSPASQAVSPMPGRSKHDEDKIDIELGEPDDGDGHDDGADADVEDLELPSPVQTHRPPNESITNATDDQAGSEDEDDLDKQLALAMAEEDEAEPQGRTAIDSDEESEEE